MAELQELIEKIENPELRAQIADAAKRALKQKRFGLVFEEHLPECTPLYDIPVRKGSKVSIRDEKVNEIYTVLNIADGKAMCLPKNGNEVVAFDVTALVTTAELGEPIYPCLQFLDEVCNAPSSNLWHTLIEADNYHALQLLEYLYAGKVDCIYIDPPYNKEDSKDWKYNCNYVDRNDEYRHSKWLSMIQKRLSIAKKLLNPNDSVLIVTIDEEEYLHLGCLLEEMFPEAKMQMISALTNSRGVARESGFARVDEYIYVLRFGCSSVNRLPLSDEWRVNIKKDDRVTHLRWSMLIRSGSHFLRSDSPNQFYPIFVNNDGRKIHSVGESYYGTDRNEIVPPEGTFAVWPLRKDGTEGNWQISNVNLRTLITSGFVMLGRKANGTVPIYYLKKGEIAKVQNGTYEISGYREDGSIISDSEVRLLVTGTQWRIGSHDASIGGTNMLKSIFGTSPFTFPKSIYSVHDTIRFFVANKPEALILDFFAGSGTTLHAVNLLNAEDSGHRRCIMVTNNEVSSEEEKELKSKGFHPGDDEWSSLGVARHVTWPRTVCSIKGKDINGNAIDGNYGVQVETYVEDMTELFTSDGKKFSKKRYTKSKIETVPELAKIQKADGFASNAIFFKLGFLDKTKVSLGMQFKELLSTLWMKAGAIGKCPVIDESVPDMLILPENKMAILNDENRFGDFAEQLAQHPEIDVVYLVTDYESSFVAMTQALEGKQTYQLYRDYLDNFRINAGRNGR